jgi:hypothetical protein
MSTRDREQTESTEQPDTTEKKAGHIADTTRERQWCWCEVRQDESVLADEHFWNSTTAAEQTEDGDERMLQIVHWEQEADEQ